LTDQKTSKLSRLVRHDVIKGDPEDIVHLDWYKEWKASE
jgi:hypothetical protein